MTNPLRMLETAYPKAMRFPRLTIVVNTIVVAVIAWASGYLAEKILLWCGIESFNPEVYLYIGVALLALSLDTLAILLAMTTAMATVPVIPPIMEQEIERELTLQEKIQLDALASDTNKITDTAEKGMRSFVKPFIVLVIATVYILINQTSSDQITELSEKLPSLIQGHPLAMGTIITAILWSLRNITNIKVLIGEGKIKVIILRMSTVIAIILYGIAPIALVVAALWVYFAT